MSITEMEGVGEGYGAKLAAANVKSIEALLEKGGDRTGRSALADATGVDSVAELAQRNAPNLAAKRDDVNATKNLANRVPNKTTISQWIIEAKTLPKKVTH
jgi:hypothetical protein